MNSIRASSSLLLVLSRTGRASQNGCRNHSSVASKPTAALSSWLRGHGPAFPVDGKKISILKEPSQFFDQLLVSTPKLSTSLPPPPPPPSHAHARTHTHTHTHARTHTRTHTHTHTHTHAHTRTHARTHTRTHCHPKSLLLFWFRFQNRKTETCLVLVDSFFYFLFLFFIFYLMSGWQWSTDETSLLPPLYFSSCIIPTTVKPR